MMIIASGAASKAWRASSGGVESMAIRSVSRSLQSWFASTRGGQSDPHILQTYHDSTIATSAVGSRRAARRRGARHEGPHDQGSLLIAAWCDRGTNSPPDYPLRWANWGAVMV